MLSYVNFFFKSTTLHVDTHVVLVTTDSLAGFVNTKRQNFQVNNTFFRRNLFHHQLQCLLDFKFDFTNHKGYNGKGQCGDQCY